MIIRIKYELHHNIDRAINDYTARIIDPSAPTQDELVSVVRDVLESTECFADICDLPKEVFVAFVEANRDEWVQFLFGNKNNTTTIVSPADSDLTMELHRDHDEDKPNVCICLEGGTKYETTWLKIMSNEDSLSDNHKAELNTIVDWMQGLESQDVQAFTQEVLSRFVKHYELRQLMKEQQLLD